MASVDLAVSVFELKKRPSKNPSITLRTTVLKKAVGNRSLFLLKTVACISPRLRRTQEGSQFTWVPLQ